MVVTGTIYDLDTINREVSIRVNGQILPVDVPVTCRVHVNGERVKLRLLQTRDYVLVEFKKEADRAVAESIEVRRQDRRGGKGSGTFFGISELLSGAEKGA
jgi:hypothetical protein